MAEKTPLKARYSGSDAIALGEFEAGDTIPQALITNLPSDLAAKAGLGTAQTFSAAQRAGVIADNDLALDLSGAGNDYTCTPTGAGTLSFSNIAANAGKSGNIIFTNSSNYAIAKGSNIKCPSSLFSTISATGDYWLAYHCDGTNVRLTCSGALS